jgi:uncharacterized BrkB/YihY/UPF0761 family membrane protein
LRAALEWGERFPYADAGRELLNRDRGMAGNVLAAGLAFRFFLCLLPAALLYSAVIGFSSASQLSSRDNLGTVAALATVLARSSSEAHRERWLLVVLGSVFLLYTGWGLGRALTVIHSVAWEMHSGASIGRSALATAGVIAILVVSLAGSAIRASSGGYAWVVSVAISGVYGLVWIGISYILPRRPGSWTLLLPGAILIALGVGIVQIVNVFYLAPRLENGTGLFGSLGVVSAVMFGLFILARLIVTSPQANHALWRRRRPDLESRS